MGYFSTWTESAESGVRLVAPYSLMLLLFIFNVISFSFPVAGSIKAPLFLMAIYYWSIYRPTLIPAWLVFIAGIGIDLISGMPPGLTALVFVAVRWIVVDQRRFLMGQSFLMIWIGFVIVSSACGIAQWAIFGLINLNWPPLEPLWFSVGLGLAVFPLVSILLHLTHKILPEPQSNYMMKAKGRKLS